MEDGKSNKKKFKHLDDMASIANQGIPDTNCKSLIGNNKLEEFKADQDYFAELLREMVKDVRDRIQSSSTVLGDIAPVQKLLLLVILVLLVLKPIPIGKGGFGIVYKAETNDKKPVALKGLISSVIDENIIKNFVKELKLLRMVSYHDNINRFLGITKDNTGYIMRFAFKKYISE
ncbi:unnamed protein product [Rhizophagus irregularis]|nr:unnamed protein product [Rhizophagus irregularis]